MNPISSSRPGTAFKLIAGLAATASIAMLAGCGGGGGGGSPTTGSSTVTASDPAPCKTRFSHIWVTVMDVTASTDASANPKTSKGGFVDLTPGLSSKPVQLDLMNLQSTECTISALQSIGMLGSASGIPPGSFQQIRLELVANGTTGVTLASNGGTNECASIGANVFNCVQPSGGSLTELTTPSGSIKIPPGQLQPGGLKIAAGQGVDIDIDFNGCTSVVSTGNGSFNLKPTLRAFELGVNPLVAGKIVVGTESGTSVSVPTASPTPVPNANVWLEQQSVPFAVATPAAASSPTTEPVDNMIEETATDSSGNFTFCPAPAGTFDLVVDAPNLGGATSTPTNPTIATGVSVTSSGGPNNLVIPLIAPASGGTGTFASVVNTANTTAGGDDVAIAGTQAFTPPGGGSPVEAQVPPLSGSLPASGVVETSSNPGNTNCSSISTVRCAMGSNCGCLTLNQTVAGPVVGTANSTGGGYADQSGASVKYSVSGSATELSGSASGNGGTTPECDPSMLITDPFAVVSGSNASPPVPNPALDFTGCD